MSRKKRGGSSPTYSKKRKQHSSKSRSPAIPIVVGLVVVVLVMGAIVSFSNLRSADVGNAPGVVATAEALATRSIPYPDVPRIALEETLPKLEQGEAVLVDVRSRLSYEKAHAAEAISVPEEEIDARIGELPRDQVMVLYCT